MTRAATSRCCRRSVSIPDCRISCWIAPPRSRANSGFAPDASTLILLAHGSRRNSASREATEQVARAIERRAVFRSVGIALLEERPFLDEAMALVQGPAVVVGMFSGEGMHGASDAPRLIAELNRNDIVYAGVIGDVAGVDDLVAGSVTEAVRRLASDARDGPTIS